MKTINIPTLTISCRKVIIPPFWRSATNFINKNFDTKLTVKELKSYFAGSLFILMAVNIFLFPFAIFAAIYLLKNQN